MIYTQAILVANCSGIALLFVIFFNTRKKFRSNFIDSNIFYTMAAINIFQCLLDTATLLLDGHVFTGCRELSVILNCILYINNIVFSFLWTVYVDLKFFFDTQRIRKIFCFVAIPGVLVIIGIIANLFTPVFFSVSDENVYRRTDYYFITYLVTYFYLLFGAAEIFKYKSKVKKYLFLPVVIFLIPVFIGSAIQFLYYGVSLVWIGTAIGMTSLYINIQNEVSFTDSLSGLFTRQYMNQYLESNIRKIGVQRKLSGIMLDIDRFKNINDTFGHMSGDEAIISTGEILRNCVRKKDLAVRFAGDEFIVILPTDDENEIKALIEQIERNTEKFNKSGNKNYKIHFSIGYTVYKGKDDSIDEFLRRMDIAMYEKKEKNHRDIDNY